MKKSVLFSLLVTLSMVYCGGSLQAQVLTNTRAPRLALSPDVGPPTTQMSVTGQDFPPGEMVEVFFDSAPVGRVTTGRNGAFETVVTVPATASPGAQTVEAHGLTTKSIASHQFLVRTDWLQFHFDGARTGINPFENSLSPASVGHLVIDSRSVTGGVIESSAAYCGGRIFIGSQDGNLYTLAAEGGDVSFVFQTGGAVVSSPATIPSESCTVIVGSLDGNLYAVDGGTGRPMWIMTAKGGIRASPLVIKGTASTDVPRIVVGDLAGALYALDANGNRLWTTVLDGPMLGAPAFLESPSQRFGTLQLDPGERVYVGTQRGTLYGIDPASGAVAFAKTIDGSSIVAAPVVSRGADGVPKVFVGTTAGVLYALFADDGSVAWSVRTGGAITGAVTIGDPNTIGDPHLRSILVVGSSDGNVYAFDNAQQTPVLIWIARVGVPINTSPALANGVVYFSAGDGRLRGLDAVTGRQLFTSAAIGRVRSSPIVADGMVAVGAVSGEIVVLRLQPHQ
jgi:outer membrane protein assembly factor BamB